MSDPTLSDIHLKINWLGSGLPLNKMSESVEQKKRRGIRYLWSLQKRIRTERIRHAQWKYRK